MKSTSAVDAAWSVVTSTNPVELDRDGIVEFLQSIASIRAVCDAAEVLAVRRTRELSAAGTSEPAEHVLANQTGRSSKNARDAAIREEACHAMPVLEAGLADGTVSAGHLDVAAAAHSKLDDHVAEQFASHADELASRSRKLGVDAFERECRDLARHLVAMNDRNAEVDELERQRAASSVKRWVDRATGMHNTLISLDPLRDSKMWKVINHQTGREKQQRKDDGERSLPFAALQAQAFVTAVTNTPGGSSTTPSSSAPPDSGTSVSDASLPGASTPGPALSGTTLSDRSQPGASQLVASPSGASQPGASPSGASQPSASLSEGPSATTTRSSAPATSGAAARLPEISILCDLDTLVTGIRATGAVCETDDGVTLPPDTVRRLACDAKIVPILLGTRGEVLDQGRQARTATPAQRNALAAMHLGCAFPGCTVGFSDCRIHHIRWWWEHHGRTDIDNLLPLCEKHHHLVHEGGWGLVLDADRAATWSRPDGSVHHRGPTISRRPQDFPLRR